MEKRNKKKAGVARIMLNTLRNNAENSTAKVKQTHLEKIGGIRQELQELRATLPEVNKIKFGFDNSLQHSGKILFTATNINFAYDTQLIWKENLSFQITSGERISLTGRNGSGKTTLIKLIMGDINPQTGNIYRAENKSVYINQDYSLINDQLKLYEQAQQFNITALQEHDIKIRLNRFYFQKKIGINPVVP